MTSASKRVVLAGGGTAGHVNPLLATAIRLRELGAEVKVLGTKEGLEDTLVSAAGFELIHIPKVLIPRRPSPQFFSLPKRLTKAVEIATETLVQSDALVGFGGYVSAPAYLAAKKLQVPTVIHEQNAKAGWANKLGARSAQVVALTFADTKLRSAGKIVVTGLPLRPQISQLAQARQEADSAREARSQAAQSFGLDPQRPTLLITGGSLGAQHLNEVVTVAPEDLPAGLQIIHLTGKGKAEAVQLAAARASETVTWLVLEYLEEMERAFAVADLVLCRAGASTSAELGALGLPAFYVPLPIGNGEQKLNAKAQVEAGAACLVEDKDFTAQMFQTQVLPLIFDATRLEQMGQAMRKIALGDGAETLAKIALAVAK